MTDDLVTVTVSNDDGSWTVPTVVIPAPLTSVLPMRLLIAISISLATAVAFTYALLMLVGLLLLLPGFRGASRNWWLASTIIQGWHLVEHTTLQVQAIVGTNLFGSPVPTSFLQPFIPRPELHLVYNLIVFIPMIVAVWLHTRPSQNSVNDCTCAAPPFRAAAAGMASA